MTDREQLDAYFAVTSVTQGTSAAQKAATPILRALESGLNNYAATFITPRLDSLSEGTIDAINDAILMAMASIAGVLVTACEAIRAPFEESDEPK